MTFEIPPRRVLRGGTPRRAATMGFLHIYAAPRARPGRDAHSFKRHCEVEPIASGKMSAWPLGRRRSKLRCRTAAASSSCGKTAPGTPQQATGTSRSSSRPRHTWCKTPSQECTVLGLPPRRAPGTYSSWPDQPDLGRVGAASQHRLGFCRQHLATRQRAAGSLSTGPSNLLVNDLLGRQLGSAGFIVK